MEGKLYVASSPRYISLYSVKGLVTDDILYSALQELQSHGADDLIRDIYGPLLADAPEAGYSVSVQV